MLIVIPKQDLADGQTYVLKKSFSRNVSNSEIYEQCKIQSIACILAGKRPDSSRSAYGCMRHCKVRVCFTMCCFTMCLCNSPDLDGYRTGQDAQKWNIGGVCHALTFRSSSHHRKIQHACATVCCSLPPHVCLYPRHEAWATMCDCRAGRQEPQEGPGKALLWQVTGKT